MKFVVKSNQQRNRFTKRKLFISFRSHTFWYLNWVDLTREGNRCVLLLSKISHVHVCAWWIIKAKSLISLYSGLLWKTKKRKLKFHNNIGGEYFLLELNASFKEHGNFHKTSIRHALWQNQLAGKINKTLVVMMNSIFGCKIVL